MRRRINGRAKSGRFLLLRQQKSATVGFRGARFRAGYQLTKCLAAKRGSGLPNKGSRLGVNGAGQVSAGCGTIGACRVPGTCLVTGAVARGDGALGAEAAEHESQNENPSCRPPRRIDSRYLRRALGRTNSCMLRLISRHRGDPLIGNLDMRSAQTVSIPKLPHYPTRDMAFG